MHEALAIPELFDRIIQHSCSDSASLLALACTCRIFEDPAISLLYGSREIDLTALIKSCLPDTCTKSYKAHYYMVITRLGFTSTRHLSDEDCWRRFDYYSSKVKILKIDVESLWPDVFTSISIHSQLRSHFAPATLFPRLESLSILRLGRIEDVNVTLNFLTFFVKTVSQLSLMLITCDALSPLKPLIPALPRLCPALTSLKVSQCSFDEQDYGHCISELFTQVRAWREIKLTCHNISPVVLASIKSLPYLERLSLSFWKLERTDDLEANNEEDAPSYDHKTKALEHFQLNCPSIDMPRVFRIMKFRQKPPTFVKLTEREGDFNDVFLALKEHCAHSAVRHLTINLGNRGNGNSEVEFVEIQFLLSFNNIRELKLQEGDFELYDRDIHFMAEAWATLRVLHLSDVYVDNVDGDVGPSLSCLLPLSAHCLQLAELLINLNASVVPKIPSEYSGRLLNKAFETLILSRSCIEDSLAVRSFLLSVFPTIKNIVTPGTDDTGYSQEDRAYFDKWSKVLRS